MDKQKLIDRMNKLKKLIPNTIKAIHELPEIGYLYTSLDPGELQIQLIYNPNEYLSLRRMLAKRWKHIRHSFNDLTGNYYVYFRHRELEDIELHLELEIPTDFENGSSCRLVETGYRTAVVYGLECKG